MHRRGTGGAPVEMPSRSNGGWENGANRVGYRLRYRASGKDRCTTHGCHAWRPRDDNYAGPHTTAAKNVAARRQDASSVPVRAFGFREEAVCVGRESCCEFLTTLG